jgi:circadian clock protein KaiC
LSILERISTGVPGLDSLIEGGIPKGSTLMVVGTSGSGKTILCSHFLYDGLTTKEESGLYISFSESKAQFYANLKTLGMDFNKFERQAKFAFLDFASLTEGKIKWKETIFEGLENSPKALIALFNKPLIRLSFTHIFFSRENQRINLRTVLLPHAYTFCRPSRP